MKFKNQASVNLTIFLILSGTSAFAKKITCELPSAPGMPAIQIQFTDQGPLKVNEVLQSNLTGLLYSGKNLKSISKTQSLSVFDLGQSYTLDYSLWVEVKDDKVKAHVKTYDRDDATTTSVELTTCL